MFLRSGKGKNERFAHRRARARARRGCRGENERFERLARIARPREGERRSRREMTGGGGKDEI